MLNNKIRDVGEQLASCPLGQILFRFTDRVLWTLETSVQWFMKSEDKKRTPIRPLPWILFLPLLLWLRFIKIVLTLISFVRRKETLSPIKVVTYIQIYRRRLRSVKCAGLKNFTNWRMEQGEKKKADGECIIVKLLGIYWLSTFTGFGRVISQASSSKVNQEKQLKPIADESYESSETEYTMENLNQICEESNSDDDPEYDPLADKCDVSEDSSSSSDSSDTLSTLSLDTAEAGSESTSQTFYSSSNITPEPTPPQASYSAGDTPEQSPPVEEIPRQTSPDSEHAQQEINHIEEKQREELPSNQNGNVPKQDIHNGQKSGENSIPEQTIAVEKRSDFDRTFSSLVEEKQNEQTVDNKINNVHKVNLNSKELEIYTNISSFPLNRPTGTVKMETLSVVKLPSAENHLENSVQKHSETPVQKNDDFVKGSSSNLKEKYDANLGTSENQFKQIGDKHIQPDTEEFKHLNASIGNDHMPLGNPSSDLINSESAVSLPPYSKSDSTIGCATSTQSVQKVGVEEMKPKRRFSDFFIKKKNT